MSPLQIKKSVLLPSTDDVHRRAATGAVLNMTLALEVATQLRASRPSNWRRSQPVRHPEALSQEKELVNYSQKCGKLKELRIGGWEVEL